MKVSEECVLKGLIFADPEISRSAFSELTVAERMLNEAKDTLKKGNYIASILSGYVAIFRSARAVLFTLGFREKSHFCLFEFLIENVQDKSLVELLKTANMVRITRHKLQYSDAVFSRKTAEFVVKVASDLYSKVAQQVRAPDS